MNNRNNIEEIYPLSPMQQGMLFHSLYAPLSGAYVIQVSYELHGDLNIPAFEQTWQYLLNRHSVLRTAFVWENLEQPLQVVGKQVKCNITHLDWQNYSSIIQQQKLKILLEKQRQQGFNLSKSPLMQVNLIQLAATLYQVVWSYHHLLLDGWSMPILLKEFLKIYNGYNQNKIPNLSPITPYRDYIAWLQKQDNQEAETFWKQQLNNLNPLILSDSLPRQKELENSESKQVYIEQTINLSKQQTEQLNIFVKQQQITLNTLVQAAFSLLLSHYSGETDIVFGAVCAGRPTTLTGFESMVGMFINTLPLRISTTPQQKLNEWLKSIHQQQIEIREYEYCSLIDIQRWSGFPASTPLFDTLVVFENYPVEQNLKQSLETLQISNIQTSEQTNYPLTLYAIADSQLSLRLLYDCDRFSQETITQLLQQLENLLLKMVSQDNCSLWELSLLSSEEQQQMLFVGNGTAKEIPNLSVYELIAKQAQQTPDATAIVFEGETLTYTELNAKANQIAHYLHQLGIQSEARIGVYLERSPLLIIALLGILKAGAVYVPLDPIYPSERLQFVVEDAQMTLLLTETSLINNNFGSVTKINLDEKAQIINQEPRDNLEIKASPRQLAYLIYTSGSTGTPKGVMVEMRSLVNILIGLQEELGITATDKLLAVTTIAFDIAALELFLPLIVGGQVVLTKQTVLANPNQLEAAIEEYQITVMQATPATWKLLLANGWNGKSNLKVLCGGEALDNTLAQQLLTTNQEVWNLYGPTETTIWSAIKKLEINESVTIGHPIANTQFYVLNQYLQPVAIGVSGELYIGGTGVARGYWGKPDLTAERFLPNNVMLTEEASNFTLSKEDKKSSSPVLPNPLYKTGDRVRYLTNGDLEYLGRFDNQVKIRGFRIELGEIEAVLQAHSEISQAVVNICENERDNKRLIAYLVAKKQPIIDEEILIKELRKSLEIKLPVYMIPCAFIVLDKLPLTPNGKINRKVLLVPNEFSTYSRNTATLPQTEIEHEIAKIWQELLHLEQVSIYDNFFDLGGHSLLVVRMQGKLRHLLNQEIPLIELFRYPTINSLAAYLSKVDDSNSINQEIESRINQLETGKQRLRQRRQQIN
ncbi:MAG: amino acid adenylation domain-containing protein [Calothrix sp. CSU_2_0]|nr:amino acid adenylation domain-containing protein [Calothrix sp. CSU_2_0]